VESIRLLAEKGVTRAVETGAGGVLTGLLRSIAPGIAGLKFGEPNDKLC
jgi:malonyl CoA-acyl carrier protein transacylase